MKIIRQFSVFLRGIATLLLVASATVYAQPAGTVTYIHNDLLGSPVAATNAAGTVIWRETFSGYGERKNQPADTTQSPRAANKVWYTSRHQDEDTGLVYMGARYYDPALGRFLSMDSVGFDEKNVHSFNRYAYANNNPYRFRDPDGNQAIENLLPAGAPIIANGKSLGALAAYAIGVVTGNTPLVNAAVDGMAENRQANIDTIVLLATVGRGTRTTKVEPIKDAAAPHTTWKTDPQTGQITRHETWTPNSRNPTGWDTVQSTDLRGAPHVNKETGDAVATPHTQGKSIPGGVRPATVSEIPKN